MRVLTAGRRTDIQSVHWARHWSYGALLRAGVRIWEYEPATMHAMMHRRTPVVDGTWSAAGSMNFDKRSLAPNIEVNLVLLDGVADAARGSLSADDHALVREGLRLLLDAQPDMQMVGEAGHGEERTTPRALRPDVIVIELSMPGIGSSEATAHVRRDCPDVGVLALTGHEERVDLAQLLRAGAAGYVLRRAAPTDFVRANRTVMAGGVDLDPVVVDLVGGGFLEQERAEAARRSRRSASASRPCCAASRATSATRRSPPSSR